MMIATAEDRRSDRKEGWRTCAREALLVEQLARATRELRTREAQGGPTEKIRAVIRSLRRTLASIAERGGVWDLSRADFALKCTEPEKLELWYRGRKLPVDVRLLGQPLGTAGVCLEPGQVLLADREWVKQVLEESLVGLTLEEFRVRERKTALLRALHDDWSTLRS